MGEGAHARDLPIPTYEFVYYVVRLYTFDTRESARCSTQHTYRVGFLYLCLALGVYTHGILVYNIAQRV